MSRSRLLVILAGGATPPHLYELTGAKNRADVPLGKRSLLEEVCQQARDFFPDFPIVVVTDKTSVPRKSGFLKNDPSRGILEFPGYSPGASASLKFALDQHQDLDELIVLYSDTLFLGRTQIDWPKDFIGIGTNETEEDWGLVARAPDGTIVLLTNCEGENRETASGQAVCGLFGFSDPRLLKKCLSRTGLLTNDFLRAVELYSKKLEHQLEFVQVPGWLDLGHFESYTVARKSLISGRLFNQLDVHGNWVIKTCNSAQKAKAELKWFRKRPSELDYMVPRTRPAGGTNSYEIEYLNAPSLGERASLSQISQEEALWVIQHLSTWLEKTVNRDSLSDSAAKHFRGFLASKFEARVEALFENSEFSNFNFSVNGLNFPAIALQRIDLNKFVPNLHLFPESFLHGDLYFGNIISSSRQEIFKLIDPRGFFGKMNSTGSQIYEWAKIGQSLFLDFDSLERGSFDHFQHGDRVFVSLGEDVPSEGMSTLRQWFLETCPSPLDAINLSALQMIASSPLHKEEGVSHLGLIAKGFTYLSGKSSL